jgi:hypothetical protein
MANGDLVTQRRLAEIIGQSRLQRLLNAGWLAPAERTPRRVLDRLSDVHKALAKAERSRCPPNRIAVRLTRDWEQRTGNGYQKVPPRKPAEIDLDFSAFGL